jgi:uncharacterized protein
MDYTLIDRSSLLNYLFYPRRDFRKPPPGAFDLDVPVDPDVSISCRAFPGQPEDPWILFFHGNGEVAGDYDGIAPYYNRQGLSLLVADYRGYGASGGTPTFSALIRDARAILKAFLAELPARGFIPNLWVMGRSLGSISALELAYRYPKDLRGVIFESGFVSVVELVNHLGLPSPGDLSALERECRETARGISIPALVLHGEEDSLVPLSQGRALFEDLGSAKKELVTIPGAGHNDIMFTGMRTYMEAIRKFVEETAPGIKQELP